MLETSLSSLHTQVIYSVSSAPSSAVSPEQQCANASDDSQQYSVGSEQYADARRAVRTPLLGEIHYASLPALHGKAVTPLGVCWEAEQANRAGSTPFSAELKMTTAHPRKPQTDWNFETLLVAERGRRSPGASRFDSSSEQRAFLTSRGYRKEFEAVILVRNDFNARDFLPIADAIYRGAQAAPSGGSVAGWIEANLLEPADGAVKLAVVQYGIEISSNNDLRGVYSGYKQSSRYPGYFEVTFDAYVK